MRQYNGSSLLGPDDPRGTAIGIIEIAPGDSRQDLLTALLTQEKLNRQQIIIVHPEVSKALQRGSVFEEVLQSTHARSHLWLISADDSSCADVARRYNLPLYSSLEEAIQTLSKTGDTQNALLVASPKEAVVPAGSTAPPSIQETKAEEAEQPSDLTAAPVEDFHTRTTHKQIPIVINTASIATSEDTAPARSKDPTSIPPSRSVHFRRTYRNWRRPTMLLLLLLMLLLVLGSTAAGFLGYGPLSPLFPKSPPSAIITIIPTEKYLNNTYQISIVPGIADAQQRQVSARFLYVSTPEESQTVPTTGSGTIAATQATGELTFYNALTIAQTIPVGTVITDANGVQVVNDKEVTIEAAVPPAEGKASVAAHAVLPGAHGNVPTHNFNTTPCCYTGITVSNDVAFSGGVDEQNYPYVQQMDINTIATLMKGPLLQSGQKMLESQILQGEQTITPVTCEPHITADAPAGARVTSVTVVVRVTCIAEVYNQHAAQNVATALLTSDGEKNIGTNYALVGPVSTSILDTTLTDNKGRAILHIGARGLWVYQFTDAQKTRLLHLITGKKKLDGQLLLQRQAGVQRISIDITGGTGDVLPEDIHHITITIK